MELQIKEYKLPEEIQFNFEELRNELQLRTEEYKTVVYTAENIREARSDRAKLNALKKSLNDERIRLEREFMAPFQTFKSQVAELCSIVDEASKVIDKQVKEYEELQKQEKYNRVMQLWTEILHSKYEWVPVQNTWNDRWLNASYSLKQIKADLEEIDQKITQDLGMLERLPEYSFEAIQTYQRTLKVEDALWTADNLKLMAEAKQQAAVVPTANEELPGQMKVDEFMAPPLEAESVDPGEPVQVLRFQCYCTMTQAKALRQFMIDNNIKFERA